MAALCDALILSRLILAIGSRVVAAGIAALVVAAGASSWGGA